MSNNQLVPVKRTLPALIKRDNSALYTPVVSYGLLDPLHYSFTYDNDLDKEYLKHLDSYLGCLKKTRAEMQKMTK